MLVEHRNGTKQRLAWLVGEFTKLPTGKAEEKRGVMWLRLWQPPSNHFRAKVISYHTTPVEALMDSGDLIPHHKK